MLLKERLERVWEGKRNQKRLQAEVLSPEEMLEKHKAQVAKSKSIIDSPVMTEVYKLTREAYPSKLIVITNGAEKVIGRFPAEGSLKKLMNGKVSCLVKAKVIDGQFELMKVL